MVNPDSSVSPASKPLQKIVSGGQTGADLAALDAAMECAFPYGGWIPKGRKNEDGDSNGIPSRYQHLREMASSDYEDRTEQNVVDSDGTAILFHEDLTGGTLKTAEFAAQHSKPILSINLDQHSEQCALEKLRDFVNSKEIATLNVAGPRRSEDRLIYEKTHRIIHALLAEQKPDAAENSSEFWLGLRAETLANFRHWDQIRWLIPSWYTTLAVLFAGFGMKRDMISTDAVRITAIIMAIFGVVSLFLELRLIRYHNTALRDWESLLAGSQLSARLRHILKTELPFAFELRAFPWPATVWFILLLIILMSVFFLLAVEPGFIDAFYPDRK